MRLRAWLFVAALAAALSACATRSANKSEEDFDEDKKSWKEIEAQLPPYPKEQNLILVKAGSETSHRFYIDAASLTVGADEVVRYAVVVKTTGGASNVTYEGMRCETREQKLYALGHADGTWIRARDTSWKRVLLRDLQPHHYMLWREYLCASGRTPTPPRLALNALRRGVGIVESRATD